MSLSQTNPPLPPPPSNLSWLGARLSESGTWASLAAGLTGIATYLGTNGWPQGATWVAAVGAGASAIAGFILKEKGAP